MLAEPMSDARLRDRNAFYMHFKQKRIRQRHKEVCYLTSDQSGLQNEGLNRTLCRGRVMPLT